MKKFWLSFLAILLILLIFCPSSFAQKKSKENWTPEEKSVLLLPTLANKGYLTYGFSDKAMYVKVEPLFWKAALHREKVELVEGAIGTAKLLNEKKNMHITGVMFYDMTTENELAHGFVSGISPGKIVIVK